MITYAADETLALHIHIDRRGHEELNASAEGADVYLLILGNNCLAKVQADASAESVETGSVEGLAMIDVLVAAIACRATYSLAVLADGQRAL